MRLSASARTGSTSPALPMPYPKLAQLGLKVRAGQMSLTVAAPGIGKSQLWQNLAHRMGVPTLYWSGDTSQHDVLMRACAMWTGKPVTEVEASWHDGAWQAYYDEKLAQCRHIDWVFESAIRPPVVKARLAAFAEIHGTYPSLVVIDNLSNTVENQADSLSEQQEVMTAMQRLARESGAHVAVLAHAKGEYESGTKPIPQGGVLNNLFKLPEVGITLHRADDAGNLLGLNLVKMRGGKGDPAARHPVMLDVDFTVATVKGWRS